MHDHMTELEILERPLEMDKKNQQVKKNDTNANGFVCVVIQEK